MLASFFIALNRERAEGKKDLRFYKLIDAERTRWRNRVALIKMWSNSMVYSVLVVVLVNIKVGIVFYIVIAIK